MAKLSREQYASKLLSVCRAIITNQVTIPFGALKIDRLLVRAERSNTFEGIDLTVFSEYVDQFNGCPVGTERLLWDKDALKEEDKYLDKLTADYKDRILDKCFEIIKRS
jgi:hypothetical protein